MADYGLLAGIGEGLKAGLSSYKEAKSAQDEARKEVEKAALEERRLAAAQKHQQEQMQWQREKEAADTERQYRTSGFKQDESGAWNPDQEYFKMKAEADPFKAQLGMLGVQQKQQDIKLGQMREKEAAAGKPEERQAGLYGTRAKTASAQLEGLEQSFGPEKAESAAMSLLPGFIKPEQAKQIEQAEKNFMTAVLRKESGASISPEEKQEAAKIYFVRAGDTPAVIEQKRLARQQAIEGLDIMAGPAAGSIKSAKNPSMLNQSVQPAQSGPKVGAVEDGYKYIGGDPSNSKSWEKVK